MTPACAPRALWGAFAGLLQMRFCWQASLLPCCDLPRVCAFWDLPALCPCYIGVFLTRETGACAPLVMPLLGERLAFLSLCCCVDQF